jgi:hypothetical protein
MMPVLAIARAMPNTTIEQFQKIRPEEIRMVWTIYRRGDLLQVNYCTDREIAVLTVNCNTIDEAKKILADLPMVREHYIEWDYYPIGPFRPWDGLLGVAAATPA